MSKNYEEEYLEVVASNPNAIIYVPEDELSESIILTAIENGLNLYDKQLKNKEILNSNNISANIVKALLVNHSVKVIVNLLFETHFGCPSMMDKFNIDDLISIIKYLYSKEKDPSNKITSNYVCELVRRYENDDNIEFASDIIKSILFDNSVDKIYKYYLINVRFGVGNRYLADIVKKIIKDNSDNPLSKDIFLLRNLYSDYTGFAEYREIFANVTFIEYVDNMKQIKDYVDNYENDAKNELY